MRSLTTPPRLRKQPPPALVQKTFLSAPRKTLWLAAWAASATALVAADRTSAPQALESARIEFQREMVAASLAPLKKHLGEVMLLEKQYAAARNYGAAIETRDQRRQVEAELERLDKELLLLQTREQSLRASALPDRVPLKLPDATLRGVIRKEGALSGWSKPGASATWKLPGLPPGGYEVWLRYRCGALEGGSIRIQEARFALEGDIETTLKGPQERNLGTLKVTDGSGNLTITARTVVKDNLMHLLDVHLAPASR